MTEAVLKSRLEALKLDGFREAPDTVRVMPSPSRIKRDRGKAKTSKGLALGVVSALLAGTMGAGAYLNSTSGPAVADRKDSATAASAASAPGPSDRAQPATAGRLLAAGFIVPNRTAVVSSPVMGIVQRIVVREGDHVSQGQPIAYLDDGLATAALDQAQARIGAAAAEIGALEAQYREASLTLERKTKLIERGFVTRASLEASQAEVSRLSAQIEQARANRSASSAAARGAAMDRGRFVIRAPFDGVIVARNVEAGEVVSPVSAANGFARTGVVTLVDMNSLGGEVDVSELHISRVKPGQTLTVTLDAYPNEKFRAVVAAITPIVDRARATIKVKIELLDKDPRILPQMAIRASFQ